MDRITFDELVRRLATAVLKKMKNFLPPLSVKLEKYIFNFKRLSVWKNKHKGQKCILICNGPSLNKVEFHKINLDQYVLFGSNKIYLGFDSLGIRSDYIVAINKNVLEQAAEIYNRLNIVKFISNRVSTDLIQPNQYTYFINTKHLPKHHKRFSENICKYVHEGWTVTHAALQIIHYMGFTEVNIVGMDHLFRQHQEGMQNQPSIMEGNDIDHFHPDYFGHGKTWDFPDLKQSEISYMAAREAFEKCGGRIFDCTIGGACTVFERREITKHLYDANKT